MMHANYYFGEQPKLTVSSIYSHRESIASPQRTPKGALMFWAPACHLERIPWAIHVGNVCCPYLADRQPTAAPRTLMSCTIHAMRSSGLRDPDFNLHSSRGGISDFDLLISHSSHASI
jgi:hypothetical protein